MSKGLSVRLPGVAGVAVALLALTLSGAARAREMCGLETFLDANRAGTRYEDWSSMCVAGQGCVIISPRVVDHRLKLFREPGEDNAWLIKLETPDNFADLLEGVVLKVDDGEDMRVPPEFLREASDGRGMVIRAEVAPVVLKELLRGRLLHWSYKTDRGETVDVSIPVKKLAPVAKWAVCMDKKLIEMATGGKAAGGKGEKPAGADGDSKEKGKETTGNGPAGERKDGETDNGEGKDVPSAPGEDDDSGGTGAAPDGRPPVNSQPR